MDNHQVRKRNESKQDAGPKLIDYMIYSIVFVPISWNSTPFSYCSRSTYIYIYIYIYFWTSSIILKQGFFFSKGCYAQYINLSYKNIQGFKSQWSLQIHPSIRYDTFGLRVSISLGEGKKRCNLEPVQTLIVLLFFVFSSFTLYNFTPFSGEKNKKNNVRLTPCRVTEIWIS